MLRTNYLIQFKDKKKHQEFIEEENDDDNYVFNSAKPIDENVIKKMSEEKLRPFVEKILTHRRINSVLYSTTADKEIKIMEKINDGLKTNKNKHVKKTSFDPNSVVKDRVKKEMISKIVEENQQKKQFFKEEKADLEYKNRVFNKTYINGYSKNQERQIIETHKKYKLDRMFKVFNTVKEKLADNQIVLPNVEIDPRNVYCRLYNNVVHLEKKKAPQHRKSVSEIGERSGSLLNMVTNEINTSNKPKNFTLKNVIKFSDGKEFTMKITDEIIMSCFSHHSGGPKMRFIDNNEVCYIYLC